MTEVFRCRVDRKLLAQAKSVAKGLGLSPAVAVRMLFVQMVNRKALPFTPTAGQGDDLLDGPRRNRILSGLDDSEGW